LLLVPSARAGWSWRGAARIATVGVFLASGLIPQHLGLDRSTEAVTAFLTNLTVLFVPLLLLFVFRKPPAPILWLGVVLATVGIWMLTSGTPKGFGVGEALSVGCAIGFSAYILGVDAVGKTENPWRLTAGQFLVAAAICAGLCLFVEGGTTNLRPGRVLHNLSGRDVWVHLALLTAMPTLAAFGLMNFYQPRIDPTRAALIYLIEPVAATAYAWGAIGRRVEPMALAGAGLILAANIAVEVVGARGRRAKEGGTAEGSAAERATSSVRAEGV
jgi:drug/metabolite transporter (DMT)-like permease